MEWEEALGLLRTMWRIRLFEERVGQLKRADEVHGLIHLSVGQEGVAAGVCSQLRDDDAVYSGHRAHGHAIAAGAPLERAMAELMGRADGLCKGLGGSMHLVDAEHGLMGATGVVGGNIPMALGSALAARLGDGDQVAVVFFGDGAVQAGHFNESINLAALWELPVIFVCENNGFAEFTPRSAHTKVERVSDVVAPYGLTRETVDGNDVGGRVGDVRPLPRRGARRARAAAARVPDPPAARPLRGRPGALPRGARGRGLAGEGPDPAAASATASSRAGSWRTTRRRSSARRRGGRGGGRVRAREPVPAGELIADLAYAPMAETTLRQGRSLEALGREAMRDDERVFVLGEDVAEGGPYTADRRAGRGVRHRARAQHADLARARSAASRSARPSRACGRWSRSCSSTSSRWRSTSS